MDNSIAVSPYSDADMTEAKQHFTVTDCICLLNIVSMYSSGKVGTAPAKLKDRKRAEKGTQEVGGQNIRDTVTSTGEEK